MLAFPIHTYPHLIYMRGKNKCEWGRVFQSSTGITWKMLERLRGRRVWKGTRSAFRSCKLVIYHETIALDKGGFSAYWERGIRILTDGTRTRCPTIKRSPKVCEGCYTNRFRSSRNVAKNDRIYSIVYQQFLFCPTRYYGGTTNSIPSTIKSIRCSQLLKKM